MDLSATPSGPSKVRASGPVMADAKNSNDSASVKSYESIDGYVGGCKFGTLYVVGQEKPEGKYAASSSSKEPRLLKGPTPRPRKTMTHTMGGGDIVLVLDLPSDFIIGYDCVSYSTRPFIGIKHLPAGPHYFWTFSNADRLNRCGFWIMSTGTDFVHVVQWDYNTDVFRAPVRSEARNQAEDVHTIFSELCVFRNTRPASKAYEEPLSTRAQVNTVLWERLSDQIDAKLLDRVIIDREEGWNSHASDRVQGWLTISPLINYERRQTYSVFQSHDYSFAVGREIRRSPYLAEDLESHSFRDKTDATPYVMSRLDENYFKCIPESEVVGELQFAYIVGVCGACDAVVRHWWFVVFCILLKSYRLALIKPKLVAAWLDALAAQLFHSARSLDTSIFDGHSSNDQKLCAAIEIYRKRLAKLFLTKRFHDSEYDAVQTSLEALAAAMGEHGWSNKSSILRKSKPLKGSERVSQREVTSTDSLSEVPRPWTIQVLDLSGESHQGSGGESRQGFWLPWKR